jgi:hypothetical protein
MMLLISLIIFFIVAFFILWFSYSLVWRNA